MERKTIRVVAAEKKNHTSEDIQSDSVEDPQRAMKLMVNGQERVLEAVDPHMPLLWAIRDMVGLTGTKFGCGQAFCGACTVHVDAKPVRSCSFPVSAAGGRKVTTIEGVSGPVARAVQGAWIRNSVPQCGYCQSGQIMSAIALLSENLRPSSEDIETAMSGNLCRCGTYPRIKAAIAEASLDLVRGARHD
jgi:isoquinoline 1-oxidoreductase subunit alpha